MSNHKLPTNRGIKVIDDLAKEINKLNAALKTTTSRKKWIELAKQLETSWRDYLEKSEHYIC